MSQSNKIYFLESLRGIAAIYVLFAHTRWLLWEGTSIYVQNIDQYSTIHQLVVKCHSIFDFGHEAVIFFFVLSGFVIHLKYAKSYKNGSNEGFDFKVYFIRRFKRIYPALLFAIGITFILDGIGKYYGFAIYQSQTPYPVINGNVGSDTSLSTFLFNLAFLGKFFAPIFGSNSPLWSLQYEWWFYMIYPLFSMLSKKNVHLANVLVLVLFYIAHSTLLITFLPLDMLLESFICWWVGVVLADVYYERINISLIWFVFIGLAAFIMRVIMPKGIGDLFMAVTFSGLIASLCMMSSTNIFIKLLNKGRLLGEISYSLYITHFPVLVLLSGYFMSINKDHYLPQSNLYIVLGAIPCFALAVFSYKFIEKPFLK